MASYDQITRVHIVVLRLLFARQGKPGTMKGLLILGASCRHESAYAYVGKRDKHSGEALTRPPAFPLSQKSVNLRSTHNICEIKNSPWWKLGYGFLCWRHTSMAEISKFRSQVISLSLWPAQRCFPGNTPTHYRDLLIMHTVSNITSWNHVYTSNVYLTSGFGGHDIICLSCSPQASGDQLTPLYGNLCTCLWSHVD